MSKKGTMALLIGIAAGVAAKIGFDRYASKKAEDVVCDCDEATEQLDSAEETDDVE